MFRTFVPLLLALALLPRPAASQAVHLCTGLGLDDREEAAVFPHTLKLVFAEISGKYIGDVAVRVMRGGATILDDTCDGPWLMMNLPPGRYVVTASFEGQTKTGSVRVGRTPSQHAIVFEIAE